MILKNRLIYLNPRISLTDWQHFLSESTSVIKGVTVWALLPSRIPLPPPPHCSFTSIMKNVACLRHISILIFIIIIIFLWKVYTCTTWNCISWGVSIQPYNCSGKYVNEISLAVQQVLKRTKMPHSTCKHWTDLHAEMPGSNLG